VIFARASSVKSSSVRHKLELRAVVALCWNRDRNLGLPRGTLPSSQASIAARSDHRNGLGQNRSNSYHYNARAARRSNSAISRVHRCGLLTLHVGRGSSAGWRRLNPSHGAAFPLVAVATWGIDCSSRLSARFPQVRDPAMRCALTR